MAVTAQQTEAQAEFWRDFYLKYDWLDNPQGRAVVEWVLRSHLSRIKHLKLEDAAEHIAATADAILEEGDPPPSLKSLIQERQQAREAATPEIGARQYD